MGHIYTAALNDGFDTTVERQRESMFDGVNKAICEYNKVLSKILIAHNKKLQAGETIDIAQLDTETQDKINQLRKTTVDNLIHVAKNFITTMDAIA